MGLEATCKDTVLPVAWLMCTRKTIRTRVFLRPMSVSPFRSSMSEFRSFKMPAQSMLCWYKNNILFCYFGYCAKRKSGDLLVQPNQEVIFCRSPAGFTIKTPKLASAAQFKLRETNNPSESIDFLKASRPRCAPHVATRPPGPTSCTRRILTCTPTAQR